MKKFIVTFTNTSKFSTRRSVEIPYWETSMVFALIHAEEDTNNVAELETFVVTGIKLAD